MEWELELAAQRASGVSFPGDTQMLSGHNPEQHAQGTLPGQGGWTGAAPGVPSRTTPDSMTVTTAFEESQKESQNH